MYLSVKDPLEKLMKCGFAVTVFSIDYGYFTVSRATNLTIISEISEVFKFDFTYSHLQPTCQARREWILQYRF